MTPKTPQHPLVSTFSIVARDPLNGDLGVATQSKFLAVGSIVPWAQATAGAVATQANANFTYGPDGLALLASGLPAEAALQRLVEADPERAHRQVGIVDARGGSATFTGEACFDWAGGLAGPDFACQGNILVGAATVQAMADAFLSSTGPLAERLVAVRAAGQARGGDSRGQQSAALLVARAGGGYGGNNDRYIDLRVDDHPQPIDELARILRIHRLLFEKTPPEDCIPVTPQLALDIQTRLHELGFYRRSPNGRLDDETRAALEAWAGVENLEERLRSDDLLDPQVLASLRVPAGG
ncbi:MAG: DUF1028 domain-containing protein [Caldilineales bacterium]